MSKLFENFGGTLGRKRAVSWANIITKGLSWLFGELATTRRCVNQQPTCTLSPCPSNRLSHWGWWDHGGFEEDYDVGATASICYWLLIYIYLHLSKINGRTGCRCWCCCQLSNVHTFATGKISLTSIYDTRSIFTLLVCICCTSLKICVHRWTACIPTRSNNKVIQHHPINVFRQELWSYLPSESIENPYFATRWF